MKTTIGTFEAKTHFSHLLEQVEKGQEITITKRGKAVAKLIPYRDNGRKLSMKEIMKGFEQIRKSIKVRINIKEMVKEGRM